jgi:hypothetical protein
MDFVRIAKRSARSSQEIGTKKYIVRDPIDARLKLARYHSEILLPAPYRLLFIFLIVTKESLCSRSLILPYVHLLDTHPLLGWTWVYFVWFYEVLSI